MRKTIAIRPIYDERLAEQTGELHYHVELNLYTDTSELADISYITEELTKTVGHMEYMLKKMEESRNRIKEGDTDDK